MNIDNFVFCLPHRPYRDDILLINLRRYGGAWYWTFQENEQEYTNFASGEQDDGGQTCAGLADRTSKWQSLKCTVAQYFACKRSEKVFVIFVLSLGLRILVIRLTLLASPDP